MRCSRAKPKPTSFLMVTLPESRTVPNRAFHICEVDYVRPILIKNSSLRKPVTAKNDIYMLLNTWSTYWFNWGLKYREFSKCVVNSDNGLNFVGEHNHFLELCNLLNNARHNIRTSNFLNADKIKWNFIPATAPNMGGIWKVAVKSAKSHMPLTLGNSIHLYEDLYIT